jgi:hypothetical protein
LFLINHQLWVESHCGAQLPYSLKLALPTSVKSVFPFAPCAYVVVLTFFNLSVPDSPPSSASHTIVVSGFVMLSDEMLTDVASRELFMALPVPPEMFATIT